MAKIVDKMFNRVIEGDLKDLSAKDGEEIAKVVSGGTQLYKHSLSITGTDEYESPTSWTVECIHYLNDVFSATSDDYVKLSKALSMTNDYNAPCYILGAGKLVYLDDDQITWVYNMITAISDVVTPL